MGEAGDASDGVLGKAVARALRADGGNQAAREQAGCCKVLPCFGDAARCELFAQLIGNGTFAVVSGCSWVLMSCWIGMKGLGTISTS